MPRLEIAAIVLLRKLSHLLLHGLQITLKSICLCSIIHSGMPVIHRSQHDLRIYHYIVAVRIVQDKVRAHPLLCFFISKDITKLITQSLLLVIVTTLLQALSYKEIIQDNLSPVALSLVSAF